MRENFTEPVKSRIEKNISNQQYKKSWNLKNIHVYNVITLTIFL